MKRPLFIITIFLVPLLVSVFAARPLRAKWLLYSAGRRTNKIYGAYRPFAYRWVEAPYKQKAGTDGCVPAPQGRINRLLLDIARLEELTGQTSATLQLRGRAGLLSCHSEDSIRKYKLALLLDPQNPDLELELGIAYALDAEADPQLEQAGALDYEAGMETVLLSGRLRQCREFMFDSALLFQEAQLPIQAQDQWTVTAKAEKLQEWRKEDLYRDFELRNRIHKRQEQLTMFSLSPEVLLNHRDEARNGSEIALDAAVEKWLPEMGESGIPVSDLQNLAALLVAYHHDHWLTDVLKVKPSSYSQSAFRNLSRSARYNLEGDHLQAAVLAHEAEKSFKRSHSYAGELRARIEAVYAYERRSQISECLQELKGLRPQAEHLGYTWIAAQAWLGEIHCRTRKRDEDVIKLRKEAYDWISTRTGYEGLRLRALGFMTEEYVSADSRLTLWRRDEKGLRSFWSEPLPALRGYSFYYTLADSAKQAGDSDTAVVLLRESTLLMKEYGSTAIRALLLSYLGTRELETHMTHEAQETFREMEQEYSSLSPSESEGFREESEVIRAAALISTGNPKEGLLLLHLLTGSLPWPYQGLIGDVRRPLFPALGNAYLGLDRLRDACASYHQSIAETWERTQKVDDPAQRDNALREVEPAWRGMTAVMLKQNHVTEALKVWEAFRSGRKFMDISAVIQNQNCSSTTASERFSVPHDVSILVYAFLPGGLSGWIVSDDGIEQHWIDERQVVPLATRFAELVARPDSPQESVSTAGRELYSLLLNPFAHNLPPKGTIVIDAEKILAGIPWAAMEDQTGRPLIAKFALCQTIGLADVLAQQRSSQVDLSRALIFGSPVLKGDLARLFPVLSDASREAQKLHRRLAHSLVFEGEEATADAFKRNAPESTIFHFAGHGISYGGFGALLLATNHKDTSDTSYFSANEIAGLDLHRMDLVMLAACSSGEGEQSGIINLDSLTRAFLGAGAQRVIAANWEVDSSSTANLITAFYDQLTDGTKPAESLRQAQLKVRQTSPHPYYWAGFQVFGLP